MIYVKATSDIFIKYLFGKQEHAPILIDFINAVQKTCDLPCIREVEIKNPFNIKTVCFEKESVLDIKAEAETGEIFNIEVQTSGSCIFKNRSLYYWAKLYAAQLEKGTQYKSLHPVICINILDFTLFGASDRYHLCFMLRDVQDPELFLTDHLVLHYLELPKLRHYNKDNYIENWLYYLKNQGQQTEDENMKILLKENPVLNQVHEKYMAFTRDPQLLDAYEAHMKWKRDYATGIDEARKQGMEKGMEQERYETARRLKALGMATDLIRQATGLAPDVIENLSS